MSRSSAAGSAGCSPRCGSSSAGSRNIRVIDRAGDFGGTWYWSRYPGAACDVESYIYMPLLEETGYIPTEKYAKAPEIFAHCQRIATQFDLYPTALFQTLVKDLHWIDEASRWMVETDRGDRIRARFVVTAGGILHKAKLPGIPGLETFKGKSFHTGRWDYDYTGGSSTEPLTKLADKRVAIIGTGATGVQIIPKLAASAQQVYRIPAHAEQYRSARQPTDRSGLGRSRCEPGWQQARIENFTRIVSRPARRRRSGRRRLDRHLRQESQLVRRRDPRGEATRFRDDGGGAGADRSDRHRSGYC